MKKQILTAGLIAVMTLSQSAFAQKKGMAPMHSSASSYMSSYSSNYKNEVDLNLSTGLIHSYKLGDNSYTDFNAYGSYRYSLQDHIQVGGEGGVTSYRSGTSNKNLFAAMGVFTYNIDTELKNSAYGEVGAGLYPSYKKEDASYNSNFSFFFSAGKRFAIWDHVNYKPFVRIAKYGDQDMEFLIQPLNVSLMF